MLEGAGGEGRVGACSTLCSQGSTWEVRAARREDWPNPKILL